MDLCLAVHLSHSNYDSQLCVCDAASDGFMGMMRNGYSEQYFVL